MRLAVFEPASGRIQAVLEFTEANATDALLNIPDGYLAVEVGEGVTPATHYIGADDQPTEYPDRPGEWAVWTGTEWADPRTPADHEAVRQAQREAATLTKSEFLQGCIAHGFLTPKEATVAARGDIPEPFRDALAAMTPEEQDMLRVIWPAVTRVTRMDPLLLAFAAGANIAPETLDALFGLAP